MTRNSAPTPAPGPAVLLTATTGVTVRCFLLPLARAARDRGWRVGIAANGVPAGGLSDGAVDRAHELPWRRTPLSFANVTAWWRVRALLRDYDLVHCHTPVASWLTRLAAASLRRPPRVVYTAHGLHVHAEGSPLGNRVFALVERVAARWTDRIVVMNADDLERATTTLGYDSSQVVPIPGIGVALRRLDAVAAAAPSRAAILPAEIPGDAPVITVVAEFTANKQHGVALQALAQLDERRAHLVLVGDGPLQQRVAARALELGLRDRVHLLGYRADVPAILCHSDVNLLCSAREGLPVSLMEAMALGVPCVGSDIRGIRDLLGGGAGRLFPNADAAACARALDAVLGGDPATGRMVSTARDRVEELGVDTIVPRYLELYERVLGARRPDVPQRLLP